MRIPEFTSLQWIGIYLIVLPLCISIMLTFKYRTVHIFDVLELWMISLCGLFCLWYECNRLNKKDDVINQY